MGLIQKAIASNFPSQLLLPLAPPFCPIGDKESNGKIPAQYHGQGGWWPLKKWDSGVDDAIKDFADKADCNVGLLLGKAVPSFGGSRFAMIDIDLDDTDNLEIDKLCDAIERAIGAHFASLNNSLQCKRYACWVRKTVGFRAAILVRLPAEQSPGSKYILPIFSEIDPVGKSKIEFLTEGQQCCIGGVHQSNTKIKWYRSDIPNEYRELPLISEDTVPAFASWENVVEVTKQALSIAFADQSHPFRGVTFSQKAVVDKAMLRADETAVSPRDLAAPSSAALIRLLNLMPNPAQATRDDYTAVMMAAAGARWGLFKTGKLSINEDIEIGEAAVGWASRWESPDASDFQAELDKWEADWKRRENYYSGWRHLVSHASHLGADISELLLEGAQESFDAVEGDQLDAAFYWDEAPKYLAVDKNIFSEYWFATKFLQRSGGRIKYIPEEKRWIIWSIKKHGWFSELAKNWAKVRIQEFLNAIALQTDGLSVDEAHQILSAARFNNVERIIMDRVAFPRALLDNAPWTIQTPDGAYDLRQTRKMSQLEQRENMDTRYTNFSPAKGPTPLWNDMLYLLCDESADTVEWLKSYLAYSILGEPASHKFLYIWGTGQNGKSTLLHIMKSLLGGYAGSIDRDVWLQRAADKHPASLYKIRGLRLAMTSEMPPNETWNESRLKAVTGCDEIEARPLHMNPMSFTPAAALIMVGQNIPVFKKIDNSIVRRVCIIGTAQSPRKVNPQLANDILKREGNAILYDLIERCRKIHETGIYVPPLTASMMSEVKEYFDKTDSFFAWAQAELLMDESVASETVPLSVLSARYAAFYKRAYASDPLAQMVSVEGPAFLASLRRLGLKTKDFSGRPLLVNGELGVQGCRLKLALAA